MMPVQDMAAQHSSQPPTSCANPSMSALGENINYKKKYKALKRKMQMLVYEQECFMEELKKAQRRLLKVSRDRSFLLDRLLKYEKLDDTSDDSDVTASSDSEAEVHKEPVMKRKKTLNQNPLSLSGAGISLLPGNLNKQQASWLMQMSGASEKTGRSELTSRRKTSKVPKKSNKTGM
ncbi:hypothetical protein LSH36_15g12033 [Paralvinella palmiformis]|uniref:INO80 complex subunit E N-terminal domain-containing protein n=1 Tax=Paralvinella palmiformis TaxID=53620 RepID=A0AAD9KC80_9ANNE|nr:hypothetical protein LSH36_15g12033 [Paralvinella palmiformis]